MTLKANYLKFIDKFVHERDANKAAMSAGFTAKYGAKLYAMPEVREEIDKRLEVLNLEKAKLTAQVHVLGKQMIDEELTKAIKGEFGDIPGHMGHKLDAIEMGYKRIGVLAGGEFIPDQEHVAEKPNEAPRIYRATHASIITQRIETRQEIVKSEVVSNRPEPIIEAEPPYKY